MGEARAWVTLATNDSYSLGALVLAHSLRRVATQYPTVVLITPGVTPIMRERLSTVFTQVVVVDVLDSGDAAHLALLARPELGITFTKLHCWTLTQYSKCVFLDADTLVLQNCDELFEREELSAAPDVGWPDCFNSGVFVYKPSKDVFQALLDFAKEKGSFDGGDQGLLNSFFSDWAFADIKKHLPFVYNVCSTSFYSYLPALKQFGGNMKILHFIGNLKPWLQSYNWGSRSINEGGHLQAPLQYWWDLFTEHVHPTLDAAMDRWECGAQDSNSCSHYLPPIEPDSQFPWHRDPLPSVQRPTSPHHDHTEHFHDPWDYYTPAPSENHQQSEDMTNHSEDNTNHLDTYNHIEKQSEEIIINISEEHFVLPVFITKPWYERDYDDTSNANATICNGSDSYSLDDEISPKIPDSGDDYEVVEDDQCDAYKEELLKLSHEVFQPRHPYDNFYLLHQAVLGHDGCKRCSHEEPPPPAPSPSPVELVVEVDLEAQAGVAGALSQLSLDCSEQSPVVEEHLRRQGWEAGNIDYMGADSFDNIWAKISSTLQTASEPAAPAPTPAPAEEAPVCPIVKPAVVEAPVCPIVKPAVVEAPVCPIVKPAVVEAPACPIVKPAEAPACPIVKQVEAPACPIVRPAEAAPAQPQLGRASTGSTDSWEKVKTETPQLSATESSSDSGSLQSATEEPQAKSQQNDGNAAVACPRPKEKLICHLKPAAETEPKPIPTPESDLEDAATIAQSIIASESSPPIVTSPTLRPQNKQILSVSTEIPETPPVPGPVSLAQIGIIPRDSEPEDELCKVKKAPKKPPMPKTKSVEVSDSEVSAKKVDAPVPVPPPRKKEKKPKK